MNTLPGVHQRRLARQAHRHEHQAHRAAAGGALRHLRREDRSSSMIKRAYELIREDRSSFMIKRAYELIYHMYVCVYTYIYIYTFAYVYK